MKNPVEIARSLPLEAKASAVFLLASLCSQGIAFLTMPLFTRIMNPAEMGQVTNYNAWLAILNTISALGVTSGAFNVALAKFDDERDAYESSVLVLALISSCVFSIVLILLGPILSSWLDMAEPLIWLMAFMLVVNPSYLLWLMRERYEFNYTKVFIVTVINSVGGTILAAVAVLVGSEHSDMSLPLLRIVPPAAVAGIVSIFIAIRTLKKGKSFFNSVYWRFSLVTGLPLVVHSFAKSVFDVSDRVLISFFVGDYAVGLYGVVYSLSSISLIIWNAMNSTLIPSIFERLKKEQLESINKLVSKVILGYAVACFALMLVAPELLAIMATPEYYEAVYLVPPISAGIFFTSTYNLYSNLLLYKEKTKAIMLASVLASIMNIALNIAFIPQFGYVAAAFTTLASYILMTFLQFFWSSKAGMGSIYNNRQIAACGVGIVGASAMAMWLYAAPVIRYALIAAIVILGIVFRKKLLGIWSGIRN